jgi:hypothetical protein
VENDHDPSTAAALEVSLNSVLLLLEILKIILVSVLRPSRDVAR